MLLLTGWAALLSATAPVSLAADGTEVYDRLVRSTVLVLCGDNSLGSGVLVHRAKRLVLTNDHVVEAAPDRLFAAFALYDAGGELVADLQQYVSFVKKLRKTDGPPAYVRPADVVARRGNKDLALLQLDSVPATARSLKLSDKPAATGSRVFTVGNSGAADSNQLWRYTTGNVRGRSTQMLSVGRGDRLKHLNSLIMETDAPINQGDSGGPLVNDKCQLVGVNSFGNTGKRLVSGHIDIEEVRKFLRAEVPDIDWP